MNPWPVEADDRGGAPAPARPRRPRRHAEVRAHRRPRRARASERARDRGAGRRRRGRQGVPQRARRRGLLARDPDRLGPGTATRRSRPGRLRDVDESPVRCLDPEASDAMVEEIDRLRKANESLGGVFEVRAFGARTRPRLIRLMGGAHRRTARPGDPLDPGDQGASRSATGSRSPACPGSEAHDEIFWDGDRGYCRDTNRAGGVEGGMTTGEPLVVRAWMKPLPTLTKPLRSVDIATHRARRGAAGAHRLLAPFRRRGGGGGDGRVRARRRVPAKVRRRQHRRRQGRARGVRAPDRLAAFAQSLNKPLAAACGGSSNHRPTSIR